MDKGACVEELENGDNVEVVKNQVLEELEVQKEVVGVIKESTGLSPYRYTKEELLEIKDYPVSNERPDCLSEKYDSDGVWDPEKWHASLYPTSECSSPVDGYKKDFVEDRVPLKRRIADPRERLKEDDLDVVLSPQRRSFGGGCVGNALPVATRRPVSPLENKENESLRLGGARRIGSGRIMVARGFEREREMSRELGREREPRVEKERDFKDKRFRRDFGDKRVFSERRRNDVCAEDEPEWFTGGPTSQSETIELIGFDDKILEEDKRRPKRSRKRTDSVKEVECNGGLTEEPELLLRESHSTADQEVPHPEVLPEQTSGDFDFNEFFNLEKTMPGLASMIEDVLGEGPASASRFSRWFSSNLSPSGSRSSSLRSTPHEELERLAGLDPHCTSPGQGGPVPYFTPIQSVERRDKVDILELLHKAKIDLKPLLSSLNVNKQRLQQSTHSGVVLSLEEVEGSLKGLKVGSEQQQPHRKAHQQREGIAGGGGTSSCTPFMAEHLEQALTGSTGPPRSRARDPDMSAFNKLVSSMKASGTLPTHPKASQVNSNLNHPKDPAVVPIPEATVPALQQKNIFQELLGTQGPPRSGSPALRHNMLGSADAPPPPQHGLLQHRGPSPPLFTQRAPSPDYFHGRMQPPDGNYTGPQHIMGEQFSEMRRPLSPGHGPILQPRQQMRELSMAVDQADVEALIVQQDLALHAHHGFQTGYTKPPHKAYQNNRQPRMNRSPGPGPHPAGRNSPGNTVTSMLSPSFVPTSVIRKMYETKEKNRDEPGSRPDSKEGLSQSHSQEDSSSPSSFLEGMDDSGSQSRGVKACSTPRSSQARQHAKEHQERPRPGSAGHHTPTVVSPGSASPFPLPIYPVPLLSHGHVPMVRAPPPQLHPSVVQRMLVQGIQPQQLGPALMQAGIFPPHVDLAQLQGLPTALLGQPLYPLGATGHPLLPPRASTHMQLAFMQQHIQQQQRPMHPTVSGHQSQNHGPHRTNHSQRRGGSPPGVGEAGLAKWFGSDVLQQPLPSMPAKVISVDELEFRP